MSMEHNGQSHSGQEERYGGYNGASYSQTMQEPPLPVNSYNGYDGPPKPQTYAPQSVWQSIHKLQPDQGGKITPWHRMVLAIASVAIAGLFSMIILTSNQDSFMGLIGMGIMCLAIVLVNAAVNLGGER